MALTLHIVPHTHWDREWYLPFQSFRVRLVHLMDRLLDLLDLNGTYRHFMLDGQTIVLEDYLEIRPQRAREIAQFVRLGRLAIGPWHVLPDEFLVAPESLVRNLMLGDRVASRFGKKMRVGYVPDPFGHLSQLPQILRGFGIDTLAFRRGLAEESTELWWEAPDGNRALVCYLRDGYDNAARLPLEPDAFVAAIRNARDSLAPHSHSDHLLLLAGTDHQEPQPELPQLIDYAMTPATTAANGDRLDGDRLIHSSLTAYAEAVRESATQGSFPTVRGELRSPRRHHLLPGVLSTRMWIKQRNDALETLLTRWVEPFAAWAELLDPGEPLDELAQPAHLSGHEPLRRVHHPRPLIERAWRYLLENHPHDSICGCSVDQVHREMVPRFDQAEQIAQEVLVQSLTTIADHVAVRSSAPVETGVATTQPLVVFNPLAGPRTDVVTARLRLPGSPDAIEVVDHQGHVVPHQVMADLVGGERPLFEVQMSPEELGSYLGLVAGGRLLNHVIHQVELLQSGDEMEIRLLVGESGQPDYAQLATARSRIEALINAGTISRFVIRTLVAETRDLVFVAPGLPPHGYGAFYVRRANAPEVETRAASGSSVLENAHLRVKANPVDGTLTLIDKEAQVLYTGLHRFVDGGDRGDTYNYCQPEEDRLIREPVSPPDIRLIERGAARQTLEIAQLYRLPAGLASDRRRRSDELVDVTLVSRVRLYVGVRRVDIETTVDNRARDHRLRVHFPVRVAVDHAHTATHFYVERRPIPAIPPDLDTGGWIEQPAPTVPQRGWADVSDGRAGLMIANRGLPEMEFFAESGATVAALTLLRCVGWLSREDMHCRQGHAGSGLATPEAQCLDQYTFHYALIPHVGGWEAARTEAEAFRVPLRAIATGIHDGPLPSAERLVHASPPQFYLTAIKQPKGAFVPGLVVRGVNMSDAPLAVRLRPWRRFKQSARVNLNEEFIEPLRPEADGSVLLTARPWEIITVRWRDA